MHPMNLIRQANGTYGVRFSRAEWPPHGRRVSLKSIVKHPVTDPDEARNIIDLLRRKAYEGKLRELDRGPRKTLAEWRDEYAAGRSDLSDKTLRADRLALRLLAEVVGDQTALRAITDDSMQRFVSACRARGVKTVSINTYLRHLRAAFNRAKDEGYIKRLPRMRPLKQPKRLPKVLRRAEVAAIRARAAQDDPEIARVIDFALWTGARLSEIHGLRWQHVDGEHARIVGKGDRERSIPLLPGALDAMGSRQDIGPVFVQCHQDNYSKRFKAVAISAGVKHATFHMLRHTAATHMLEAGVHPKVVQQVLGHQDFRTTEIYIEITGTFVSTELAKYGSI